jgi:hypothetical protein
MNTASPPKRLRTTLKHIAGVTAGAVGLTLLIVPGSSSAQSGTDCAALGSNPMATGIEGALNAAIACNVEVRVDSRSTPYTTLSVTPQGQLHVVSTAAPVQQDRNTGYVNTTLASGSGSLKPAYSPLWPVALHYDDPSLPLFSTPYSTLDWNGETPVPTYSGSTAVYDELAPGLDFTIDLDAASAGLRFTADDAGAWNALASGLTAKVVDSSNYRLTSGYGEIYIRQMSGSIPVVEWSTPFTIRDATGGITPVLMPVDDSGKVTPTLPDGFLESAAFPLELSAQWAYLPQFTNSWGSITSAAPDLAIYRGKAGLDAPYFKAAGETADAVVGDYCDGFSDPSCDTTAEAAAYWLFTMPGIVNAMPTGYTYSYDNVSATFQVSAADGVPCVAPDLYRALGQYLPTWTWADPLPPTGPPIAGTCADGSAVYDISSTIGTWMQNAGPRTFTMPSGTETARLDGGSGRIDVYFDVIGRQYTAPASRECTNSTSTAPHTSTAPSHWGGFQFATWRPDVFDLDISWSATLYDNDTGKALFTSEPRKIVPGQSNSQSFPQRLGDGRYRFEYTFSSGTTEYAYKAPPCYFAVDSTKPEFVGITVDPPGPHYVGDTVTLKVKVADNGKFPDNWNSLLVFCTGSTKNCLAPDTVTLTSKDTAEFKFKLTGTGNYTVFYMRDKAWNAVYSDMVSVYASYNHRDYNGDGRQDMWSIRKKDGHLLFHAGKGDGSFKSGVSVASGWAKMDILMAGDLTGDGRPDLLARDTYTGKLYTYPGNGKGGVESSKRIHVGDGWNAMGAMTSAGDFNNDGKLDLLAIDKKSGKLYFYPGRGNGTFGSRKVAAEGWKHIDAVTTIGSIYGQSGYNLIARDGRTGRHEKHVGSGDGTFWRTAETLSTSFTASNSRRYSEFVNAGDLDGDGRDDLVGIDRKTGKLYRHSFNDTGTHLHGGKVVGTSTAWGKYRLAAVSDDRTYDYNNNGTNDLVARQASNGNLYLYPGKNTGALGSRSTISSGWAGMNLIETAGDFNGDGRPDLIARQKSNGYLWLYPGTGAGKVGKRVRIGTSAGWNKMNAIIAGHDYNGDGQPDLIAREKATGYLWLYPGKGDGQLGKRVRIGTSAGWNSMRELTAVGDLNHDGHADMFAVQKSSGCLYFYAGKGDGTFKSRVKLSCGWNAMDSLAAVGDFNNDGRLDWVARRKSDGNLYLYPGNGKGGHTSRKLVSGGWTKMNAIA